MSAATAITTGPKIGGQHYQAARDVTEAIDRLAKVLTGDAKYFHTKAHKTS